MSDLSPLRASKRMSANGRVYEPSPTRTASWQLGGIRRQFHHVIDIAPTILEAIRSSSPAKSIN
jgi:hypothetical protein